MKLGCGIAQPLTFGIRYPCGFLWSRNTEASLLLLLELFPSRTVANCAKSQPLLTFIFSVLMRVSWLLQQF